MSFFDLSRQCFISPMLADRAPAWFNSNATVQWHILLNYYRLFIFIVSVHELDKIKDKDFHVEKQMSLLLTKKPTSAVDAETVTPS